MRNLGALLPVSVARAGGATLIACAMAALLSCRTMSHETGFLNRSVTIEGRTYPYVVFVPRDYSRGASLPLILALHGAGERGDDGLRQLQIGAAAAIRSHPERVPAIVIFPQAPLESRWLGNPAEAAMQALEQTFAEFGGDRARTYLTGLSMGGYGSYHLAMAHPGTFAAVAVVCGGLPLIRARNLSAPRR